MKKILLAPLALMLFVISCQKADRQPDATNETAEITARNCASMEHLEEQMAADPSLRQRMMEIENFTRRQLSENSRLVGDTMEIPVVVHVIYNKTAENISDAQIASQITVLNEDFQMRNADAAKVPTHFQGVQAGTPIKFVLAQTIRKYSNKTSWGTNDAMKKTSMGGSDPVSPATHLNMWSCNLGRGLLGYAQFPGGSLATDGVVILYSAFGSQAKASGSYIANYNLGRTATHEVGHWLNLRHIWGDATCGTDYVDDTPVHNTSNGGCPTATHRSTCTGTPLEQWMNYMDYTYDGCMYMFTTGQKNRMMAVFNTGGPRASFR